MASTAVKPSFALKALARKLEEQERKLSKAQRAKARQTFKRVVERAKAKARASAVGRRETA
jgi:cobalamin biosynthesis protein CobD/CbiB